LARKLKVFAADQGFVRAVVAAPSRKAALEAWGVRDDLFARGSAREVTDDQALIDEAQASPGEVLRKPIASGADIVAAATAPSKGGSKTKAPAKGKPATKPAKPPPSRGALDKAEAALKTARAEAKTALKAFDEEQADLDRRRIAAERDHGTAIAKEEAARDRARAAYDKALAAWEG